MRGFAVRPCILLVLVLVAGASGRQEPAEVELAPPSLRGAYLVKRHHLPRQISSIRFVNGQPPSPEAIAQALAQEDLKQTTFRQSANDSAPVATNSSASGECNCAASADDSGPPLGPVSIIVRKCCVLTLGVAAVVYPEHPHHDWGLCNRFSDEHHPLGVLRSSVFHPVRVSQARA
jgi:hypothetical protein